MVDAVLAECGAVQQRLRKLPARVVVYQLLTAVLFAECGHVAVWSKLTGALKSLPLPHITATGLWQARARLGVRPLQALFDLLRGPATAIRTTGARWAGLLVVAIDGTHLDVPDDPAIRARLGKGTNQYATSGYPQILLVALVACGTRAVIDATFGPRTSGETTHGRRLTRSLHTQPQPGYLPSWGAVHHHQQARIACPCVGGLVNDVQLEPDRLRADRHGLVGDTPGEGGVDEHVHHIHRKRDLRQGRVARLAVHRLALRVDGYHPLAQALQLSRHAVSSPLGVVGQAHNGPSVAGSGEYLPYRRVVAVRRHARHRRARVSSAPRAAKLTITGRARSLGFICGMERP